MLSFESFQWFLQSQLTVLLLHTCVLLYMLKRICKFQMKKQCMYVELYCELWKTAIETHKMLQAGLRGTPHGEQIFEQFSQLMLRPKTVHKDKSWKSLWNHKWRLMSYHSRDCWQVSSLVLKILRRTSEDALWSFRPSYSLTHRSSINFGCCKHECGPILLNCLIWFLAISSCL